MSGPTSEGGGTPFSGLLCLVLEDEFLISLEIERILEGAGAQIITVSRIVEALAAIEKNSKFDVAVLDYKIEKETSVQVAEKLHAAGVPFVYLTGLPTEAANVRRFSDAPVVGKPFDSAALIAALSKALATRR